MAKQEELEDDNDLDVNMEDENSDVEQEDEEEYVPPTKEELANIRLALSKANGEAARFRLEAKNLKAQGKKAADAGATEDEEKITNAKKEVEDFYRPRLVKSAVKSALKDAGLAGSPERLLKLVDVSDFEIDENGDVDEADLDRTVDSLKSDYPELFPSKRAPRIDGGREATGGKRSKTSTADQIVNMLHNGTR